MASKKIVSEAIWHEWDQAWEHSRHLETLRSQYLGFLLTVMLGIVAAFVVMGKDLFAEAEGRAVFVSLVLLANGFAGFIYPAVRRCNQMRHFYQGIIDDIRVKYQSEAQKGQLPWSRQIKIPPPPRVSVETVSRAVPVTALVVCPLALAIATIDASLDLGASTITLYSFVALIVSLIVPWFACWSAKPRGK